MRKSIFPTIKNHLKANEKPGAKTLGFQFQLGSDTNQLYFIVLPQDSRKETYRHQETRERSFQNHLQASLRLTK